MNYFRLIKVPNLFMQKKQEYINSNCSHIKNEKNSVSVDIENQILCNAVNCETIDTNSFEYMEVIMENHRLESMFRTILSEVDKEPDFIYIHMKMIKSLN